MAIREAHTRPNRDDPDQTDSPVVSSRQSTSIQLSQSPNTAHPTTYRRLSDSMREHRRAVLLTAVLCVVTSLTASAQSVPVDTMPWDLVRTFLSETASPEDGVDRADFADRFGGELADRDPVLFKGTWPAWVDIQIDTTAALRPRIVTHTIVDEDEDETTFVVDTLERFWIVATTYTPRYHGDAYFFCEHDSIWRITAIRQLPSDVERDLIARRTEAADALPSIELLRSTINLLHADKVQMNRFAAIAEDADELVTQLRGSTNAAPFIPGAIDIDRIDPYAALDDDIDDDQRLIHQLNNAALRRLHDAGVLGIVPREDGTILLEIARRNGQSVGYLSLPEDVSAPALEPDGMFMIRHLSTGWLFYKGVLGKAEYRLRASDVLLAPESSGTPDAKREAPPTSK